VEPTVIVYIFLSYAAAGYIKGMSGLGFSTVCVGIMASFLELTTAIPLVVIPSIASCLLVMIEAGHFREAVQRFAVMYLFTVPGLLVGLWLLVNTEGNLAKYVLGVVLALYGVWGLLNPTFELPNSVARKLRGPTGVLTGTIHGLTGAAVMPMVPYLLSLGLRNDMFVQAVNISFVMSSVIVILALGQLGYVSLYLLAISIAGIVPVSLAVRLGVLAQRRLSANQFRTVILAVLIGLGVNLILFA
jgi:hypothetical protein